MKFENTDRYFIALIPSAPWYDQIQELKEYCHIQYGTKAALRSPPHLTLHMPFLWPAAKGDNLRMSIDHLAAGLSPVSIQFNGFGCFPPRVIFIAVENSIELSGFQLNVVKFCRINLNLLHADYKDQPFHPHFTIAFRDLKKDAFHAAWKEFESRSFPGRFIANTITLMKHDGKRWQVNHQSQLAG